MLLGDNLPWLFHVLLKVSTSSQTPLSTAFPLHLSPLTFTFSPHLPSSVCSICVIPSLLSPPVLWPLTAPPYHIPLNEYAASSFANNQCRQYTKERAKLLHFSPESFWMRQLLERRLEPGQDVKPQEERERECERGERGKEKGQQSWRKRGGGWENIRGQKRRQGDVKPSWFHEYFSWTIEGIKYSWLR